MRKIEAYQLSDGTIVTNKIEAEKKQKEIDFTNSISKFANSYGYHDGSTQIFDAITENVDELYQILKKFKEK